MAALLVSVAVFGQKSKRTSANNYLEYRELDRAKEAIDPCITHESTMNEAKTWYFRGLIYQAIYETKEEKYKSLHPDPLLVAYESFVKCKELDEKNYHTEDANRILNVQSVHFFNHGVSSLQAKDFETAMPKFKMALSVAEEPYSTLMNDTLKMSSTYYLGWCNASLKNYDEAEKYYLKAAAMAKALKQNEHLASFAKLSNMYHDLENYDKQLEMINLGRKSLEDEMAFVIDEANIYLATGETDKAVEPLKKAVKDDPANYSAHFALGSIVEQLAKKIDDSGVDPEAAKLLEESRQAYRTSIEKANDAIANLKKESKSYDKDLAAINSSKFDATYSLGASYFNVGVKKNEAANLIDDLKKFEVARVAADKVFDDALPILEQAFILNPDDPQLLVSLKQLYYRKMAKDDSYKAKYDDIIARMK